MNTTTALPLVEEPTPAFYHELARQLLEACRSADGETILYIQKYHPNPTQLKNLGKAGANFDMHDARLILAREHGFEDWQHFDNHLHALGDPASVTSLFERGADAIVKGDTSTLRKVLAAAPRIVKARSGRAHHATLLHYITANGVEEFRQLVPPNAGEIGRMLLEMGSEPDAMLHAYGNGPGTPLELLVSSAHHGRAGVQGELTTLLLDYGAAIEGIRQDGSPLLLALSSGYPNTAEILAARGARAVNIVTAAGLGYIDAVDSYFDKNKNLDHGMQCVQAIWLTVDNTAEANAALAFVWAAMNNRIGVVDLLIQKGVGIASKDHRGWTALHWAATCGHSELVRLLLRHKAPLEAHNEVGGTVLDQTLWATSHNGLKDEHLAIIHMLLNANARLHIWWLLTDLRPPLDEKVSSILQQCHG
ncbi:ankyrin repeat domain-containing protein [Dyadobacter sandarakinus]|uniref:Ankyrin repeat domain-containing protein n=1 Tax=Dyadobacter sandarakinus TaxID=2747268 RepID=A0ABX7I671_9BACT|nr:ankyrin repeat domain-containing protein [Dyadobacter sandarakinus]QRR00987.1 ankyrin repeat domain-containing protein [Dyadobacter sandarakinus]